MTIKNIFQILLGVSLNSVAQLLMRKGMLQVGIIIFDNTLFNLIPKIISNIFLWLSIFCYILSAFVWMAVLSKVEVSFAYAFNSLGFVIISVSGYFLFNENITCLKIIGFILICSGVYCVSRS
ncbi:transporter [Treponema primitia ZAS-2]|uniref:Transporter n=1 Tax=Treponema primitia (strain ATCC BAA-887 / DSM 12427 / ZAS-2) TaxID=545694 RepID=F5YNY6_TREPZ|nr:SMR family transporter [Treponema primitia]AEF85006.1 transporter [Treponema primitia ZAS-2]